MRILYLSYDGLTDPLGQSQILPYLSALAKKGHEIDIISFEKPHIFQTLGHEIAAVCRQHNIGYYPQRYRKNPPVISSLLDIRKMKKTAFELHRKKPYQVVHCRSYIAGMVGLQLKKQLGIRFLFDMRGFYADERVDGKLWPQSNPLYRMIYRFFKQKEREMIAAADQVVSLTHAAKTEILSWNLVSSPQRIVVIPCCTDMFLFNPANVSPQQTDQLRNELNLNGQHPVVGYVGSTGTWYLLDDMLRYFHLLLQTYPKAVFLLLTFDDPEAILQRAAQQGVPATAMRMLGVQRKNLPAYLTLFNWSVFFIQPLFSKIASSPTKQGELMSMGIPVVCNADVGDTEAIVNRYHAGICLTDTSEKSLNEAVKKSAQLLNTDRGGIKSGAKAYFSLQLGVEIYHRIYSEIAQ